LFSISLLRFGERFPPLNNAYSKELRKLANDIGQELDFGSFLREGVYACVGGPSFETTAEVNYLEKVHDLIVLVCSKAI
jgi:purine-nucleoside phosphorylase